MTTAINIDDALDDRVRTEAGWLRVSKRAFVERAIEAALADPCRLGIGDPDWREVGLGLVAFAEYAHQLAVARMRAGFRASTRADVARARATRAGRL